MFAIEAGLLLGFIFLNSQFLHFTMQVRGLLFSLRTIPMLWLQYLYSGFGFSLGLLTYLRNRIRSKK